MPLAYRVCAALLNRLPVDPTGRRVFDETLSDWRRELRTYRGLGAVIRAVVGVAAREVASQSMCRAWFRVVLWSTAWVLLSLGLSSVG